MSLRDWGIRMLGGVPSPVRAQAGDGGQIIPLDSPQLAEMLRSGSMSSSGVAVTSGLAMTVAAVLRCVTIICGQIGSKPFHLMEVDADDPRKSKKAESHPLYSVLRHRPNQWQTPSEFKGMLQAHALLRGKGLALKVRRPVTNAILALIPLHPDRCEVLQREDLSIVYKYTRPNGRISLFNQDDIFHLRDLTDDGVNGISRLHLMKDAVGLAKQSENFGSKLFKDGVKPGMIVQQPAKPGFKPLSDPAYERLKKSIEEMHGGADNAHGVLILEEGLEAASVGITNEDAQFLQTRQFQVSEIAMFFGVPPHLLGDSKTTTNFGTGVEQQNIGFNQFTMQPWITAWEETIVRDLLTAADIGRFYPKINMNASLRAATKDRADFYARALGSGGSRAYMTINEIRDLEDLPPLPGGDELPEPVAAEPATDDDTDGDNDVQPNQG